MTRAMLLGVLGSVLTLSGCSLARFELSGQDVMTSMDADTGAALDADVGIDANVLLVDAFVPPDVGIAEEDAGTFPLDSGPLELRSCQEIYGSLQDFLLCEEVENECVFYTWLNQLSCSEVCESAGGTCIGAYGNGLLLPCVTLSAPRSCDERRNDHLCVCDRIP